MKEITPQLGLWLLLILATTSSPLFGQTYHFEPLRVEDGLPQSVLLDVFQDSRGFMWFAAYEAGISRYDGANFVNYSDRDGLVSNLAVSVVEDTLGRIWVGTRAGVSIFDGKNFQTFEAMGFPPSIQVSDMEMDAYGNIWIATTSQGLFRIRGEEVREIVIPQFQSYDEVVWDLAVLRDGNVAIVTNYGIYQIDSRSERAEGRWWIRAPSRKAFGLKCLVQDKESGKVFVGSEAGLFQFRDGGLYPESLGEIGEPTVNQLFLDSEGDIWLGTSEDGLYQRHNGVWYEMPLEGSITNLTEDDRGNVWLTTKIGVYRLTGRNFFHWQERDGLPSSWIWSVYAESDTSVWIGNYYGLARWNGKDFETFNHIPLMKGNHASHFAKDRFGNLWLAAESGLTRYFNGQFSDMPRTGRGQNARPLVLFLSEEEDLLYVGGRSCIEAMDITPGGGYLRTVVVDTRTISPGGVNSLYKDEKGVLWVGTEGKGLAYIDPNGLLTYLNKTDGLSSGVVNIVIPGREKELWLATGGGIFQIELEPQGPRVKQKIGIEEGLPSYNVYSLAWINGRLWAGTDRGICYLDFMADSLIELGTYGYEDGFIGIEANHKAMSLSPQGSIWWGTVNALTQQRELDRSEFSAAPPVYITSVDLFYDDTDWTEKSEEETDWFGLTDHPTLRPTENTITFSFIAPAMEHAEDRRFQYRLIGLENDWSPSIKSTQVRFTNLSAGTYTFEARASLDGEDWSAVPGQFTFTINSFVWQRPWFIGLMFLLFVGGVAMYNRFRLRALRRTRKVLTEKVAERTEEISQQKEELEQHRDQIAQQRDELIEKSQYLEEAMVALKRNNVHIRSSIEYAKRIQEAILPSVNSIQNGFPDNFILMKPKDIVSGDFYWYGEQSGAHLLVVADCTGHGVPGAIMSMIGHTLLNQIILEKKVTDPAAILKMMHEGIRQALKQHQEDEVNRDGMDMAVLSVSSKDQYALFAGAKRSLYMVRMGEWLEYRGDRASIGGYKADQPIPFHNHTIALQPGDMVYLSTDGYADQFGGRLQKKFMLGRMKELLLQVAPLSTDDQKKKLEATQREWMQDQEQTDDMLVIGVRFP